MSDNQLKKIWLSPPHMSGEELEQVQEAFRNNWVAPAGPHLKKMESKLKEYFNVESAAVLTSGTAALHLALINLNVQPGDTVLVQSLTFSASANPIKYLGAEPVFIDSEEETWNLCPKLVIEAIDDLTSKGKKPKAIIAVDLYGMPAKWAELQSIATEFDIPIIEDSAEAAGSTFMGKKCGSFGRMAVVSFNGNKIITTGGGGALLSNDWNLVNHARFLSTQAKDNAPHYQHSYIGYNYRMSNITAGIGIGQLNCLPERVLQRRHNFDLYFKELSDIEGISFLQEPYGYYSNRWLTTIMIDPEKTGGINREHIRLALESENIESRPIWKPLHLQPVFKDCLFYGNGTSEDIFRYGLCLPSGSSLTEDEVGRVSFIVKKIIKQKNQRVDTAVRKR